MPSFVQFYKIENKTLFLNNGFSSVWNVIKNEGEILWVNHKQNHFPKVEDTVYISSCMDTDFPFIKKWVLDRPDVKFIVGGPTVNYMDFHLYLPNFFAEKKYMFDLLGLQPTADMWGLSYPKYIDNDLNIYYIYPLAFGNRCYWGNCSFCNRKEDSKQIDLKISNVPILKPGRTNVWLNKLSIEPNDVKNVFPLLSLDGSYSFFIRGDRYIAEALDKIKISNNLYPMIGVEFASNRMLQKMRKGISIETLLDVILKFVENGCYPRLYFIHAWPDLIDDDIIETEKFLMKLEPYKKQLLCINHWLFLHDKADNTIEVKTEYGKTYYLPKLDETQKCLNKKVLSLYKNFGFISYTEAGIFKHLFSGELDES